MNQQLILSVGREFGSGGHEIAEKLAAIYQLPLYDRMLLKKIAEERNVNSKDLEKYDEVPKRRVIYRKVKGYDSSPEYNVANLQFEYLKKKAAGGESFVVVGRCAETILKEYDGLISIFVLGDMDKKIERIGRIHHLTNEEAEGFILSCNKKRKLYHNYYCKIKWGDSRNYDISINSSKLGIEETVRILSEYINARIKKEK